MTDVTINKFRASVVRDGSKPSSPGFIVSEGQDPVNPPGTNNYVPYSGATANVELGEFGLDTGFVTLDTTPTNIPTEQGGIYWDDSRSTAALIMNGTLQHIGQDTFFYVKNSTGSSIAKGTAVRFNGTDGASGHLLIAPFLANGTYPSNYFMGVTAEVIANGEFGQVMHFGELTGVNTSGYTAGALLYASTSVAGAFQTTAPVAPNNIVLIAAAINSTNNGTILVRPTYGSNINQDEGVKITSAATGDLLQLQAGGLWENKTLAQVIGSAYVPSTRTITINGTTQDLSANRTYNVGTVTAVTASSPLFSSGGTTPNLTIQQASGSQSGFLSSTDWTTFNNKQNALTNPVTGTGTTNYLPKFTGSTTIGNSIVNESSGVINIAGRLNVLSTYASDSATQSVLRDNTGVALNFGGTASGFKWLQAQDSAGASTYYPILINPYGGNLLVGTTTDAGYKLDVNGTGRFSGQLSVAGGSSQSWGGGMIGINIGSGNSSIAAFVNPALAIQKDIRLFNAMYFDGTNYRYNSTGTAANMFVVGNGGDGGISLFNAPSGTSGNIVSLTKIFDITSTGASTFLSSVTARNGSSGTAFITTNAVDADFIIETVSGGTTKLGTTGNKLAINSSGGNVLIGTTTDIGVKLYVKGSAATNLFLESTGASVYQQFSNSGGNAYIGSISNDLVFLTTGAGTERMRITSGGNVLIGTTSQLQSNERLAITTSTNTAILAQFTGGSTTGWAAKFWNNGTSGDNLIIEFLTETSITARGSVTYNRGSGVTAFNTTSDYRIKSEISDFNSLKIISNLKPKEFKIGNAPRKTIGFIAHELQEFFPQAVTGIKDQIDNFGNPIYQSVDYSQLTGLLVKAIQELKQEIDTLKN